MNIDDVRRALDAIAAPYALIGAHAMAARGYPRFTVDVDFLTTDRRVLDRATWSEIERAGGTVDPRRGDDDDPLGGVVHIGLADGSEIDVILAKWKWEAGVIERAETLRVAGADILVPRTSDLILLKLAAGGFLDLRDAAILLAMGDREALVQAVEAHLPEVHPDIGPQWRQVQASIEDTDPPPS
jgi:hypothetical protein